MEDNWTVYRHISPSGKVYVGITSVKPEVKMESWVWKTNYIW